MDEHAQDANQIEDFNEQAEEEETQRNDEARGDDQEPHSTDDEQA